MASYNETNREAINESMSQKYMDSWSYVSCPVCKIQCSSQKKMNRHIKSFHSEEPQTFTCQICDKPFANKDNLERHMKEVHGGEKIYTCDGNVNHGDTCIAAYSREENLARHKKVGRHIFEFDCDYCCQSIIIKSPQNIINNRHLIKNKCYPHLTTCRNVKYGLVKVTEEDKEKFREKKFEQMIHDVSLYEASRKYDKKDERFNPYVQKLIQEKRENHKRSIEIGRKVNLEDKMMREAWDAYEWDSSMLDPISQMPLSDPVRNKRCGHLYERSYMETLIRQGPSNSKFKHVFCPYAVNIGNDYWFGCTTDPISLSDLEPDVAMKEEIDQRKDKRKMKVEKNPDLKGRLYQKADRKGLVGRSKRDFKNYLHFGFVPSNYEHERMCVASLCRLGSGRFLKFELN